MNHTPPTLKYPVQIQVLPKENMFFSIGNVFRFLCLIIWCCAIFLRAYDYDVYVGPGEKEETTSTPTYKIDNNVNIKRNDNKQLKAVNDASNYVNLRRGDRRRMSKNVDLLEYSQSHYMPKGNENVHFPNTLFLSHVDSPVP